MMEEVSGSGSLEVADSTADYGDLLDGDEWTTEDVDLLASWIAGDDGDAPSARASTATPVFPCPVGVSSDRNPTRQRQRQEIAYLRARVEEMERELAPPRGDPSEWEAIARRQRRAREKSERENLKLRGMLESQLKLARTLERLLRKRESAAVLGPGHNKRVALDMPSQAQSDREVFERLLVNIDCSYAETKAVLAGNGLWTAPRGHRRVDVKKAQRLRDQGGLFGETEHELYVEMTDVMTLPFPMEATARAAWRCITGGFMQLDHEVYTDLAGQEDVLAIKYAITLSRRRLNIDFNARAAMKRFVECDQIVDVWESISDTARVDSSLHGTPGIRVRERGWTVFRRAEGDPTRTLQLTCMQMIPLISYNHGNGSNAREDRQVGLLANLALDYYGDQLDHAQHAMENLLLGEARERASVAHSLPRRDGEREG